MLSSVRNFLSLVFLIAGGLRAGIAPPCVALVIGNSNYLPPQRSLLNTIHDANEIAERLRKEGSCEVLQFLDLKTPETRQKLDSFLARIQPGTTVYFYYSGHGVQIGGQPILVSTDLGEVVDENRLRQKSIPFREFLKQFLTRRPRVVVAIIDACREQLNLPESATDSKGIFVGLALAEAEPNTVLIYATAKNSMASGVSPHGDRSLFTGEFLLFFHRGEDLETVFELTKKEVVKVSAGAQRPWMHTNIVERVCLGGTCAGKLGQVPRSVTRPSVACKSVAPFPYMEHDRWGYLDCDGHVAVRAQYLSAWPFSAEPGEKRAPVRDPITKKYGYIDLNGQMKIAPQYDEAHEFRGGLAPVRIKGKWFFIGLSGRQQTPFYADAHPFRKGLAPVQVLNGGRPRWGYIGTAKASPNSDERVLVIEPRFEDAQEFSENGLAAVKVNGRYGFIDTKGNMVIQPQLESPERYSEVMIFHDGLCPAVRNGLWGYIDVQGRWAIQPRFSRVKNFHEGLAAAQVRFGQVKRWGYVDTKGDMSIIPSYDNAYDFVDSVAVVRQSPEAGGHDRLTPINRDGTFLLPRVNKQR